MDYGKSIINFIYNFKFAILNYLKLIKNKI